MSSLELELAGLQILVRLRGVTSLANAQHRFASYVPSGPSREPDLIMDLAIEPRFAAEIETAHLPEYPAVASASHADGRIEFIRKDLWMEVDSKRRRASVRVPPSIAEHLPTKDPTPLDTPLRLLLASALPFHDGLMVHAAGYADPRGALVFAGESGAGKTTTARKLPHEHVLSDDQVALRRVAGRWQAFSTPMIGAYGRATERTSAALRCLLILEKAERGAVHSPLSAATAVASLGRCVTRYEVGESESGRALLDRISALASEVPIARLSIARDADPRSVLDSLLGEL